MEASNAIKKIDAFVSEAVANLRMGKFTDYLSLPIPSEMDKELLHLINTFIQTPPQERSALISHFASDHSFLFLGFSERMAALAVREWSRDLLLKALIAHAVEAGKDDSRENILVLSLIYHSATKIGVDPKVLFYEGVSYASGEIAEIIASFPERAEQDRSIKAMGYREELAPDGFRYKRGNSGDG